MFVVVTVNEVIRIPPVLLSAPVGQAIHSEIDQRYPNRVLLDVGLVVGRYGDCLRVGHGVCVAGDGGSHHACTFRLLVFRPFVDEVCLGRIKKASSEGIQVSLGFFEDIFIPAYWMLRPSRFEEETQRWVWSPSYDDDEEEDESGRDALEASIKADAATNDAAANVENAEENRYEMEIGAEIRFKVKSINFTQITNTAKGMQATTTTTSSQSSPFPLVDDGNNTSGGAPDLGLSPMRRQRSSSFGLSDTQQIPSAMHIVASICEDGLGLTSWWTNPEEDEAEETNGQQVNTPGVVKEENGV